MNQYLLGLLIFIILILFVILIYDKFGTNRIIKGTNDVYTKAFITSCGIILIIFAILGYELKPLIRLADSTFNKNQTIFMISLYIISIFNICFKHAISHYHDCNFNTYKNKLKDNLFFIEATFYATLLPIYICTKLKIYIVLTGYHPVSNIITLMWYSMLNVFFAAIFVWFLYNIIMKILNCKCFHKFVKKINNLTT